MTDLERCRPWIEAALAHNGGFFAWDDVVQALQDGKLQFWPAPRGCIVTEIVTMPRRKVVNVFLGGGELEQLANMHDAVIDWAKAQGCTAATIHGRPGWERAFKPLGWTPLYRVLVKEFD